MIRFLTALVLAVVIIGGLKLYLIRLNRGEAPEIELPTVVEDRLTIDLTLTFDAAPDPFSPEVQNKSSVRVTCNGAPVLERHDIVTAGTPIQFDGSISIVPGKNEFQLTAHPQENDDRERAARIRISRGSRVLAEETLWSEPGAPVFGAVILSLPTETPPSSDPHIPPAKSTQ